MADTNLDSLKLTTPLAVASISTTVTVQSRSHPMATVATTGTTEVLFRAPFAGTVSMVGFVGKDALAQHATNFLTFAVVNKGQAGAGSTAVLASSDLNTTKTSTGLPIAGYTSFTMTLSATPANLAVAKGDILAFQAISAVTLANTITEPLAVIEFTPS